MPTTRVTYELRLHTEPQTFPFGTTTISRHRSFSAAWNAWKYEERRFLKSPYGSGCAWLPRVVIEVWPDGREYVAEKATTSRTDYAVVRTNSRERPEHHPN